MSTRGVDVVPLSPLRPSGDTSFAAGGRTAGTQVSGPSHLGFRGQSGPHSLAQVKGACWVSGRWDAATHPEGFSGLIVVGGGDGGCRESPVLPVSCSEDFKVRAHVFLLAPCRPTRGTL